METKTLTDLKKKIESASAVSFDFFDTLFLRPLYDSEDVFDILGRQFDIQGFRTLRQAAQAEAFRRMHESGRREIRLEDIYACVNRQSFTRREALMGAEYDLELSLVCPNPELLDLFLEAVRSGKPVVITSDMYLPGSFFSQALRRHNLSDVPLFISSDRDDTKRDKGRLFDIMASELELAPSTILHIGDNKHSDDYMAKQRGMSSFHYLHSRIPKAIKNSNPAASVALGMLRTHASQITPGSSEEIGFRYGGPAAAGFLEWIATQSQKDNIDIVLFLSRDGYVLNEIAKSVSIPGLPNFTYFYGSRIAFTLAAMYERNFRDFLPFLVSGADGLSPSEILERIDVTAPASTVMEDLGLGDKVIVDTRQTEYIERFLYAYRWEILKVCRRNRRGLFNYFNKFGIHEGSRVALVDVGWRGTTQEAFELAIRSFANVDIYGYYFCLAESPGLITRQKSQRMQAMITSESVPASVVKKVYDNRVAVEMFFSAPHHTIIGYEPYVNEVRPVEDRGRGDVGNLLEIVDNLCKGAIVFAGQYYDVRSKIQLKATPLEIAWPMIEFVSTSDWHRAVALEHVKNFDAWASTRNRDMRLAEYRV